MSSRALTSGERRSLLVVYDVLHFVCLHGPRLTREEVVDYLHRATSQRDTPEDSRLRAFERFKRKLKALGIGYAVESRSTCNARESYFTIEAPHAAKVTVTAILDANGKKEPREDRDAA